MDTMRVALCASLFVAGMACTRDREGGTPAERTSAMNPTVNTDSIASEIRRLSEARAKSAIDKDTATVGTIFADDARYLPNDGDASTGGIRDIWRGVMKVKDVTIAYTPKDITVAKGGDLAVERGAIKVTERGKPVEVGHYIYSMAATRR
jgi:ketosteroid isomerase-like protein